MFFYFFFGTCLGYLGSISNKYEGLTALRLGLACMAAAIFLKRIHSMLLMMDNTAFYVWMNRGSIIIEQSNLNSAHFKDIFRKNFVSLDKMLQLKLLEDF